MDHQRSQLQAVENLATEETISGKEAVEEIAERVKSCIEKQKEKIQRERADRSAEIDRQAVMKTLKERLQEESADFGKPQMSSYIENNHK